MTTPQFITAATRPVVRTRAGLSRFYPRNFDTRAFHREWIARVRRPDVISTEIPSIRQSGRGRSLAKGQQTQSGLKNRTRSFFIFHEFDERGIVRRNGVSKLERLAKFREEKLSWNFFQVPLESTTFHPAVAKSPGPYVRFASHFTWRIPRRIFYDRA